MQTTEQIDQLQREIEQLTAQLSVAWSARHAWFSAASDAKREVRLLTEEIERLKAELASRPKVRVCP